MIRNMIYLIILALVLSGCYSPHQVPITNKLSMYLSEGDKWDLFTLLPTLSSYAPQKNDLSLLIRSTKGLSRNRRNHGEMNFYQFHLNSLISARLLSTVYLGWRIIQKFTSNICSIWVIRTILQR